MIVKKVCIMLLSVKLKVFCILVLWLLVKVCVIKNVLEGLGVMVIKKLVFKNDSNDFGLIIGIN